MLTFVGSKINELNIELQNIANPLNDQQELINLKNVKLSKKLDEFIDKVQKESMNKALRGKNKLEIMDPAIGKRILTIEY